MKALTIDRYGKKADCRIRDVPQPEPGAGEILVRVHAASVNLLDAKIKNGEFKLILPYRVPLVLGHDIAGEVVCVGPAVRRFKPGDEVFARLDDLHIGAFAEYAVVREGALAHKPAALSMEEAASMPLVALTAWQALVELAGLAPGQKVFIQAGSGGVGSIAIQLAKHLGAFVATTTSTGNLDWVAALGADLVIDYTQQDFADVLRDYDVVLHSLGSRELERSVKVLKPGGRLISISGPPTPRFAQAQGLAWPLQQVLRLLSHGIRRAAKRGGIDYTFMFMRAEGEQLAKIAALVDAGRLRPTIDRVMPFEAAAEALAYVEQGHAKGKVVIRMR